MPDLWGNPTTLFWDFLSHLFVIHHDYHFHSAQKLIQNESQTLCSHVAFSCIKANGLWSISQTFCPDYLLLISFLAPNTASFCFDVACIPLHSFFSITLLCIRDSSSVFMIFFLIYTHIHMRVRTHTQILHTCVLISDITERTRHISSRVWFSSLNVMIYPILSVMLGSHFPFQLIDIPLCRCANISFIHSSVYGLLFPNYCEQYSNEHV